MNFETPVATSAHPMFSQYKYCRSAEATLAWVQAIAAAQGERDVLSHTDDLASIVSSFAESGVNITPSQAQLVFEAYAEKDCAGWVGPSVDVIAGLDWLIEEIKEGNPHIPLLVAALKDWNP